MNEPKWQPIKTAPKDGTHILVWDGKSCSIVEFYPTNGAYLGVWAGQVGDEWACNGGYEPEFILVNPTHWMLLPAAPEERK